MSLSESMLWTQPEKMQVWSFLNKSGMTFWKQNAGITFWKNAGMTSKEIYATRSSQGNKSWLKVTSSHQRLNRKRNYLAIWNRRPCMHFKLIKMRNRLHHFKWHSVQYHWSLYPVSKINVTETPNLSYINVHKHSLD